MVAGAVLGGALVVAIAGAIRSAGDGRDGAAPALEACVRASRAEQEACFAREFTALAETGRVEQTLATLETLVERRLLDDCHLQAHAVAYAAVEALGVDRAFRLATAHCRLGYLHGAAEVAGAGSEAGARRAGTRCSGFRKRDLVASCSHGFGHALVRARPAALAHSLDACRRAARLGIHPLPCEAGVLMQHSLQYADLPESELAGAASRGCAELAAASRRTRCYRNIGLVAALVNGHDLRRAAAVCRGVRPASPATACLAGAQREIDEARG